MNTRTENGRSQLESAIVNFPGMVPDSINLSAFMSEEEAHRIKPADACSKSKLIELIETGGEKGTVAPLGDFSGKV